MQQRAFLIRNREDAVDLDQPILIYRINMNNFLFSDNMENLYIELFCK